MKTNKILLGVLMLFVLAFAVSAAPTILTVAGPSTVAENEQIQLILTADAGDLGPNIFSKDVTFGTIVKNTETQATFTWTPGYDDANTYPITFTVSDDNSTVNAAVFPVVVSNTNRAPTITSTAVTTVDIDSAYYYNVDATDLDGDTLTYSLVTGPTGMTIDSDDGELRWTVDYTNINGNAVEVSVTDGLLTDSQSFNVDVVALEIDKLEVFVADNDDRLDDRDTFDVKTDDPVSFEITVQNLFSGDTSDEKVDMRDVEITITVQDWDDGDDEKWDSDRFDIRYDDKEKVTIDLGSVPLTMDEDKYDVTINVRGEDENNVDHEIEWTVFMNVEKNREDIRLSSFSIEPSIVSCNRDLLLTVKLTNAGTRDSDEIVFESKQSILGISIQDYEIEMNEGDKETLQYPIHLMDDVSPGTYSIRVSTYFDVNAFDDEDVSDSQNVELIVKKCVTVEPEPEEPKEDEVVIVAPPVEEEPVEETRAPLFSVSNAYLAGLILVNILLILGIIFLVVKIFRR